MLDPILNINHGERYKGGVKSKSKFYSTHKHSDEKNTAKDSALFSPLARLLSKINWRIINVQYPSAEKILLNFQKEDLEFLTEIDFKKLYKEPYHKFIILKKDKIGSKNITFRLELKVLKEKIETFDKIVPLDVNNLEEVFFRIAELNFEKLPEGNLNITNYYFLNDLIAGLEENIYEELTTILTAIFTLISTQQENKIKKNYVLNITENNPIMMQRLSIIGA